MAIFRLNIAEDGGVAAADGGDWRAALTAAIERAPRAASVATLIHGFSYTWRPEEPGFCPHRSIFRAAAPDDGPVCAWPGALGFDESPETPLCLAVGWDARAGGLRGFPAVYRRAEATGRGLAAVAEVAAEAGRPLDCLAHSLGARVALGAVARAPRGAMRRAILLGPAADLHEAEAALDAAGGGAQILHVDARANRVFDGLYHVFAPRRAGARPLGRAAPAHRGWVRLRIDDGATRDALARRGARLSEAFPTLSHSCFYADPGLMAFYAALLEAPGAPFAGLHAIGKAADPSGEDVLPAASYA
ncbi:MAG: hypothetical protein AAGF90_19320 [Pseudomonadota bacterium]